MNELLRFYRVPVVTASHLIGAAIAFLTPADALTQFPGLVTCVDILSIVYPALLGYIKYSAMSGVTALYFMVEAVAGLLIGAVLCQHPTWLIPNGKQALQKFGHLSTLYLLLGCSFSLALFWFSLAYASRPLTLLPIHNSRMALATIGPLFAWAPCIMLAMTVSIYKTWRDHA